jgi:cytochrome c peroxidase
VKAFLLKLALAALALTPVAFGSDARVKVPLGLDEFIPVSEDNPSTPEKVELGRQFFFDKRLSRDGAVACATCHVPERAFTDGKAIAIGVKQRQGRRNAPSLFNRAYGKAFFWDGRAKALEDQPLEAFTNPKEMDLSLHELENRLNRLTVQREQTRTSHPAVSPGRGQPIQKTGEGTRKTSYRQRFQDVFGENPTAQNAAKAIAAFVRTLLSGDSPFDRYEQGDANALSEAAKRGLQIFRGKGNCIACHSGPLFSDEEYHNTGVSWGKEPLDQGRFEVTKRDSDRGKFKPPSLRNVAWTPPYMTSFGLRPLNGDRARAAAHRSSTTILLGEIATSLV